ncbi:hypothetical protein [Pseudomonas sp. QTF5]|uniref:hypothetical protein n=1 Tax=Pseudomonas sp. QTF5 TaxID=1435425 RepID=UPI0004BE27C0|nr:hypothetical protein [Pseudomonas sp. QTF5]
MDRYHPLKTNATATSVVLLDTNAGASQLLENALLRIRAGTGLLEALTSVSFEHSEKADFYRLILSAYLPLQDGLDLLEQLQSQS